MGRNGSPPDCSAVRPSTCHRPVKICGPKKGGASMGVAAPATGGQAESTFAAVLDRVTPALRSLPGVTAVTPIEAPPFFGPQIFTGRCQVEGRTAEQSGGDPFLPIETGGTYYFRTFQIPLLRGRGFLDTDRQTSFRVAVVSEGAARILGLGDSVIGR